jgi:hypothetical protein
MRQDRKALNEPHYAPLVGNALILGGSEEQLHVHDYGYVCGLSYIP